MSQGTVSNEFRTQTNVFSNHSFNINGLKIHRNPQFDPFLALRGVVWVWWVVQKNRISQKDLVFGEYTI